MIKFAYYTMFICFNIYHSFSQVVIETTKPNTSSILELSSTNQGLFPPRMTEIQRNAIVSPAEGLFIYNTDRKCFSKLGFNSITQAGSSTLLVSQIDAFTINLAETSSTCNVDVTVF
ncbi:hypothetical protein [Flavivirga eckloniae]|uniref:Uncharacterized protein n=1 Tax=Flavivirga eckloniae TaxID=1803846 RepID=A0A2K9PNG1_9FLAO|nr:hypothetical protein [Flavivirga eckloniae]AUP78127.1 hypothetical protein C1H87_05100 [Flavivirga eckloniae]